jgi:hypothetical protein
MNSLIIYPLLLLLLMAGINQLYVLSSSDLSYSNTLSGIAQEGNQTLNSEESQLKQEAADAAFNVNMTAGFIALIIGLVAVGVVAGIRVLGSGLSEYSVQLIHKATTYYGLWGVFSALGFTGFNTIPYFGLFLWFGMTLIYSLGFFQSLQVTGGS